MTDNIIIVREAYRLAEQRLEWQFTAALAADQRAVSAASMLVAAAAILAALAESSPTPLILLFGATGLVGAASLAWYSARPVRFYAPGACFEDLAEDILNNREESDVLKELGGFHDKHIATNDKAMQESAKLLRLSFVMAAYSVLFTVGGHIGAL